MSTLGIFVFTVWFVFESLSALMGAAKKIKHEKLGQTLRRILKVDSCRNNVERWEFRNTRRKARHGQGKIKG